MIMRAWCLLVLVLCGATAAYGAGAGCEVTVQEQNRLTLNCSRRNIDDIPEWPPQIKNNNKDLPVLISFYNNTISTISLLEAVPGPRIALNFKDNEINEIEDDAFSNMQRLMYLDLSSNRISGDVLRSEIFHGPYENGVYKEIALETLDLGENEIHSLDRYLFQYTPNLTRLFLNNNPLEILDHVTILAISSATNLEHLDLANTEIDSIPLDAFRGLVNLQHIDLSDNKFLTVPESLRVVGSSLLYLTFNNNLIFELNDDSFEGLTNLIELEVGENDNLAEVKRSTFTPLKNLKVLHLCHNRNLKYISHNAFRGLKDKWTLKEVHFDDNNLSELSTDLMPWSKLETLGMSGNRWLCNCDLANIVTTQGAGGKFNSNEVPFCAAPLKMSGAYITNISLTFCPTYDTTYTTKRSFSLSDLKPKHVLWSIFGVGLIVVVGMLTGLAVNGIKKVYGKTIRSEPIRYVNLNSEAFP